MDRNDHVGSDGQMPESGRVGSADTGNEMSWQLQNGSTPPETATAELRQVAPNLCCQIKGFPVLRRGFDRAEAPASKRAAELTLLVLIGAASWRREDFALLCTHWPPRPRAPLRRVIQERS